MDKKKKEAITGLLVGFVGLIFLFYFNFGHFGRWEFVTGYTRVSLLGNLIYDILKSANNGIVNSGVRSTIEFIFWLIQISYIGAVWYYRNCIGYWFYKIIRMVYKKI